MPLSTMDQVRKTLETGGYIADEVIATAVFLAASMEKPILIEGPPGVGKTSLAQALSGILEMPLVRLQCYEGIDEGKALYDWEYGKQLLYTQLLRTQLDSYMDGASTLSEAVGRLAKEESLFFSEQFLVQRPVLRSFRSEKRSVLLIDEIDRSDDEFEALLLECLSDFQISIPELGIDRGAPEAARHPHQQRDAAHLGRPPQALPLPLHRVPGARAGGLHRTAARPRDVRGARRTARRVHAQGADAGPAQAAQRVREPRLGAGALDPEGRAARREDHHQHGGHDREAPGRHRPDPRARHGGVRSAPDRTHRQPVRRAAPGEGIRVSPGESVDAVRALGAAGWRTGRRRRRSSSSRS